MLPADTESVPFTLFLLSQFNLNKYCEGFIASWHPVGHLELSGIKLQPGKSEGDMRL